MVTYFIGKHFGTISKFFDFSLKKPILWDLFIWPIYLEFTIFEHFTSLSVFL